MQVSGRVVLGKKSNHYSHLFQSQNPIQVKNVEEVAIVMPVREKTVVYVATAKTRKNLVVKTS